MAIPCYQVPPPQTAHRDGGKYYSPGQRWSLCALCGVQRHSAAHRVHTQGPAEEAVEGYEGREEGIGGVQEGVEG